MLEREAPALRLRSREIVDGPSGPELPQCRTGRSVKIPAISHRAVGKNPGNFAPVFKRKLLEILPHPTARMGSIVIRL
jgi:hypothetical protein